MPEMEKRNSITMPHLSLGVFTLALINMAATWDEPVAMDTEWESEEVPCLQNWFQQLRPWGDHALGADTSPLTSGVGNLPSSGGKSKAIECSWLRCWFGDGNHGGDHPLEPAREREKEKCLVTFDSQGKQLVKYMRIPRRSKWTLLSCFLDWETCLFGETFCPCVIFLFFQLKQPFE